MAKKQAPPFPEQLVVRLKAGDETFSAAALQGLYDQVVAHSKAKKHASCFEWMDEFKIPYAVATFLMDRMEIEGLVKPLKEGESGPRKYA